MTCRILLVMAALSACFACATGNSTRDASVQRVSDGGSLDGGAEAGVSDKDAAVSCIIGDDASDCRDGLCRIPAGSFVMGAPRDEPFAAAVNDIQVNVQLTREFLIGQSEVTLAEWRASGFPDPIPDWRRTGSRTADTPPKGYSECTEPTCPVMWMNYEDAMAYTNKRSEQEGLPPCYQLSECSGEPGRFLRAPYV